MRLLLLCTFFALSPGASAWDSVGHRLSAAIAVNYLGESTKVELRSILQHHPRFQQDFLAQMPASVARANNQQQLTWLLGQAAFWPDISRGLPEDERRKYNHPEWHYIDGAWVRGKAAIQGNSYIGIQSFDVIVGAQASTIVDEYQVSNIMTALDYNSARLADKQTPASQRALALCWVLHLIGDIHQPLHVGTLYSANVFKDGDRGGNRLATDKENLHSRWDRALSSEALNPKQQARRLERVAQDRNSDWSQWMHESRLLLLDTVYTDAMKSSIAAADRSNSQLPEFTLDTNYVEQMRKIARQRLTLAGRRLAVWFENNL